MKNPVFSNSGNFSDTSNRTPAGYPTMPNYQVGGTAVADKSYSQTNYSNSAYQQSAPTGFENDRFEQVKDQYYARSADAVDTNRMTYDDVIVKTSIVFGFLLVAAIFSWYMALNFTFGPALILVGVIGGFILAMVNSFKSEPSPALIIGYGILEGLALGGISGFFETRYPGVVSMAFVATLVTFVVCLFMYKNSIVKVNGTFMKILTLGLVSYLVFVVINFVLSFTGIFGIGNIREVTVFGMPLGIVIGVIAVILASMSLISDFDFISKGVEKGISAKFAWTAAFGLIVTLVWLYLEFLRLAAYFYDND